MALRQGWGVCSWEAGIVMKPILRERRSEAMSRTRTPGPGPAPGPVGPAGATSLLELGREGQNGTEVGLRPGPPPPLPSEGCATLWPPRRRRKGPEVGMGGCLKV